jgi:hypothetical protein
MSTVVLPQEHRDAEKAPFNSLAAIALALSFVTIIGGIVCGHVALSQIARSGERGRWMAVLALVIGYGVAIGTALLAVGIPLGAFALHLMR